MQRKGHRRVQAPHMQGTPHQAPPGPEPHPSLRSSLGACLSGLVGGEEALVVLPCPLWGGGVPSSLPILSLGPGRGHPAGLKLTPVNPESGSPPL